MLLTANMEYLKFLWKMFQKNHMFELNAKVTLCFFKDDFMA